MRLKKGSFAAQNPKGRNNTFETLSVFNNGAKHLKPLSHLILKDLGSRLLLLVGFNNTGQQQLRRSDIVNQSSLAELETGFGVANLFPNPI
jgi:hypothetical protein